MKSNKAMNYLLNRLTAMKKLLIASLLLSGTCVLNATDLTWAGGEVGNNSGFIFPILAIGLRWEIPHQALTMSLSAILLLQPMEVQISIK